MNGQITFINQRRGMAAVLTSNGGFTVIELLGGYDVQIGDVVSGDLESHGGETIYNNTQMESMDVYIQGIHCTKQNAINLCG